MERRPLKTLKANPNNPRVIRDEKFKKLVKSIKEFPEMLEARPVVVNPDMVVLGGNMRLKALREAGVEEAPVYIASWDEVKQRQFIIKDNVGFGEWDWDALANEWNEEELQDWGLDIPGFEEMQEVLEAEEDDFDVPDEIKTDIVLGDLFEIGEHRLLCGDSTDSKLWEKLEIKDKSICFTSPPYNAGASAKLTGNRSASEKGNFYEEYQDDSTNYPDLISETLSNALMFTDGVCYNVQPLANNKTLIIDWLHQWKDSLVDILTWDKGHAAPAMASGVCSSTFEWLVVFNSSNNSRTIPLSSWRGTISNVYAAPPQRQNEFSGVHAATFPIHLPEFVISQLMDKSEGVVDCFMGTGTTMVAAHQLGRKCYGMELDPKYCQVIVDRMHKLDPSLQIKRNGQPYEAKNLETN
jgi:DNA modification methylase